jgi:hypothetical protein
MPLPTRGGYRAQQSSPEPSDRFASRAGLPTRMLRGANGRSLVMEDEATAAVVYSESPQC